MATPPRRPTQQRRYQRLFQSKTLTALFGTSIANMVTRIVIVLVAVGTLVVITLGVLQPNTARTTTAAGNTANTSTTNTGQNPVGLQVGNAAPNFTLSTPSGKKVSLSDYRGQPVMLNFWYSTCPGCLAEIPGMQRYYEAQQSAGKGFVILGVNVVDDATTATQFAQQEGIRYPIVLDEGQRVESLYNINATPSSYFIDRQGIIRAMVVGPVDDAALKGHIAQIS